MSVYLSSRRAIWAPVYESILNLLGPTGVIIPIGDPNHENAGRTTVTTVGGEAAVFTYSEAVSAFDTPPSRRGPCRTPIVNFNGTDEEAETPDAAYWSRGDDTNDFPFSVGAWVNLAAADTKSILAKWGDSSTREWQLYVSSGKLELRLMDQSLSVKPRRPSDAAATTGSWRFFVGTYDGAGGANAADTMVLYDNGVVMPSTALNQASYVAMENTVAKPRLGFNLTGAGASANFFKDWMAGGPVGPFFTQKELSADEVLRLYQLGRTALDV